MRSLPRIGGSTIQDYSLSLRRGCARARRPSMRSRNIRRGVGCRGLLSFSLFYLSSPPPQPPSLRRIPTCPPRVTSFLVPPPWTISSLARIYLSSLSLCPHRTLPLDTCSSRRIQILSGIQVYLRRYGHNGGFDVLEMIGNRVFRRRTFS